MKFIKINAIGKVQDVFYRKNTKEQADKLGLIGWVKNLDDGSVLIEVAGDEKILEEFKEWCKVGPPMANVKEIIVIDIEEKEYKDFLIIY